MQPHILDGSVLEGGGQILRNAVALSALLHKPITIQKIRGGRAQPGLKNQHRTGLELAAQIASATLTGAKNSSSSITFIPGALNVPGEYTADAVTAGATALMLQISLPLLLFTPQSTSPDTATPASSVLTLRGGTNGTSAPQADYAQHILLPFLTRNFNIPPISLSIPRRGYFPKGGGELVAHITPLPPGQKLQSFTLLERGKVVKISGIAHFAKLPAVVGKDMVAGAKKRLRKAGYRALQQSTDEYQVYGDDDGIPIDIQWAREDNAVAVAGGSGIVLWAELEGGGIIGGSAVGTKAKSALTLGEEAADALIKNLDGGGCVDEWLQDQIIIFMALAEGTSQVRCARGQLELHTITAIWLAEELTDAKFAVEEDPAGTIIRCQGIGYTAGKM